MIPLTITLDIEKTPWTDAAPAAKAGMGKILRVGRLPRGCLSGKSTCSVLIEMPDGRQFLAETTMALFLGAAVAFRAREEEMSGSNARN